MDNQAKTILDTEPYNRGMGAKLNEPDNRDIHIVAAVGVMAHPWKKGNKKITDMSAFEHEDQMQHGSCVGQAEGKGAEYRNFRETGAVVRLSKRFLYTQCKLVDGDPFGQGTQPRISSKILVDKGIPQALLIPDNNSLPYDQYLSVVVNNQILTDASTYRAKGFAFCYNLDDVKTAIDVAGVMNATHQTGPWGNTQPVKPNPGRGYHRVLWYGYEDDLNNGVEDTKIYVWNSWGDWADDGNGWFWWSEYQGFLFDLMVYTDMPNEVIDYAKKQNYFFARDLQIGMTGADVTELQKRLYKETAKDGMPCFRYPTTSTPSFTSYFGTNTRDAVQRYQVAKGIASPTSAGYGRCGPVTRGTLNAGTGKRTLVEAIIQVESGGNDYAIGDKHLKDRAYGAMQIRKPVCTDVNKAKGTNYKPEDMLGNRELSKTVYEAYMALYATPQALGRPVTDQDRARIWNGGPSGWKKTATVVYWAKIVVALEGTATGVPLSEQKVATANRGEE